METSNMLTDLAIRWPQVLQSYLIEIIGEIVERQETRIRRIAAKEIIKRDNIIYCPKDSQDLVKAMVEIAGLKYRLASASTYFPEELFNEPEPYSADGILFSAFVHLVRIDKDLFAWGSLPKQVRALGLAINPGEELAWPITRDWITIKDSEGNRRVYYRFS
jgi:hypothetical protein